MLATALIDGPVSLWRLFPARGAGQVRADRESHIARESVLRGIYDSSLQHLARAIRERDATAVYHNSENGPVPRVLLQAEGDLVVYLTEQCPEWLEHALAEL